MATCDPQALLNSANCFDCLTNQQLEQVQVQMLCDLVNGGLAGGPFVRISGDTMTGNLNMGGNTLYGSTASGGNLYLESTPNANKGYVIINPNDGNVGVGMVPTNDPFEVFADTHFVSGIRITGSNYPTLRVVSTDNTKGGQIVLQTTLATWTHYVQATDMIIHDGNDNVMMFKFGGAMGIGTLVPKSKFDITGNLTVGATYSGANAAPASGAIFEGRVGIGTNAPNANALLDLVSTTLGFKLPTMTTNQKNAIANTAGLMVFDTDLGKACVNNGAGWQTITSV